MWVGCRVSTARLLDACRSATIPVLPPLTRHGVLCCRLQVRPDGLEIECLSEDGRYCKAVGDCTNFARCLAVHPTIVMPGGVKTLACGEQHKQLHGSTNYELISNRCTQLAIAAGKVTSANAFELVMQVEDARGPTDDRRHCANNFAASACSRRATASPAQAFIHGFVS